jgi:hypothetical protein
MNIQKIFTAVDEDEMNSPLPSIIYELEQQGYKVKLEGLEVSSDNLDGNLFGDFERAVNEFELELTKEDEQHQKFKLVFTDYHKFNFQSTLNNG